MIFIGHFLKLYLDLRHYSFLYYSYMQRDDHYQTDQNAKSEIKEFR